MKIKFSIPELRFTLPDLPIDQYIERIDAATEAINRLAQSAGTQSEAFQRAERRIRAALQQGWDLEKILQSPLDLRALAVMLNDSDTELSDKMKLTPQVLSKIDTIRAKPSSLLVEAITGHYLKKYDQIGDTIAIQSVEVWLRNARKTRGKLTREFSELLGGNGPKWLAEESHRHRRDFDEQVRYVGLAHYRSGRFLMAAKNIYYLEVLRGLKPNAFHSILEEMQKKSVYKSRYDNNTLLGHQILRILIEKAPSAGITDAWLNVIMTIAGDPRVPPTSKRFRKWWSQLDQHLRDKVKGWLSKLDLRLFLEALKDFSDQSSDDALKRMYPSRKQFMEGLLNKQLVTGTRLFLSRNAKWYLKNNYKPEHLPSFSLVDGDRSLIHIQLGSSHLIEGTHNCKLWIYDRLPSSAIVFDYGKHQVTYRELTLGLKEKMQAEGVFHKADITHNPHNYNWQYKAIDALQTLGVPIHAKDVLIQEDYKKYKRLYGA